MMNPKTIQYILDYCLNSKTTSAQIIKVVEQMKKSRRISSTEHSLILLGELNKAMKEIERRYT